MFQSLVFVGITVVVFLVADMIQLNHLSWVVAALFMPVLIVATIREVIKLVRK